MPSFVDAANAAGAAQPQGSSALVVAGTGAAVAACVAGYDDSSVVVAAASSPSDSGRCRKRLRRPDFRDMSDTEYREMMQRRRKEQETVRDRGRVRTGRSYPAREEQQRRSHQYRAASERRMSALLEAAPAPPQPLASTPQQSSWNSVWSEQVPALVMDQPISVNHDDWWQRLEKHGLVAGNMLTNNVEADRLYICCRTRS